MGRLKFEKEFKEKLDRREIKPSENSWNKLSSQLDSEEKPSKINVWWLGIAATFLAGILIIGLQFRNSAVETSPKVVDAPVDNVDTEQHEPLNENSEEVEVVNKSIINKNNIRSQEAVAQNSSTAKSAGLQKSGVATREEKVRKTASKEEGIKVASVAEPQIITSKEDILISKKLSEVIAQVNSMNSDGNSITDIEVEQLLVRAAREIEKDRNYNFSVGKIDPEDLLRSVEIDMEHSFRDKVFDVLKEGYLKAKTAVANRNY